MSDVAENLHNCLLIIANEIKRICTDNGINYFLIAGTLLGAVRHQGFIPWDDDMDIGMLRNDYDRFCSIVREKIDDNFWVSSIDTEDNYGFVFTKIRLKGTSFREELNPEGLETGIFVDVFPIDKLPDGKLSGIVQKNMMKLYKNALLYKCGYKIDYNSKSVIYRKIMKFVSKQPKDRLRDKLVHYQSRHNNENCEYYANMCSTYKYGRERFPAYSLTSLSKLPFENTEYMVPDPPTEPLKLLYGDYMKLPDEKDRVFCHVSGDISFGDYEL